MATPAMVHHEPYQADPGLLNELFRPRYHDSKSAGLTLKICNGLFLRFGQRHLGIFFGLTTQSMDDFG